MTKEIHFCKEFKTPELDKVLQAAAEDPSTSKTADLKTLEKIAKQRLTRQDYENSLRFLQQILTARQNKSAELLTA